MKPGLIYGGLTALTLMGWITMLLNGVEVPPEYSNITLVMLGGLGGMLVGFRRAANIAKNGS